MALTPADLSAPAQGLASLPAKDRLRILAAAAEVFAAEGYRGATREHLQRQFDPFAFDALFAGKEDCFLQTFDRVTARAREAIVASAPVSDSWPRRLATGLWTLLQLIDDQPSSARLVFFEAQSATPTVTRRFLETVHSVAPFMREGRMLADEHTPALADTVLPLGVTSALVEHLTIRPEEPAAGLYPELLELLLSYYRENPEVATLLATDTLGEMA